MIGVVDQQIAQLHEIYWDIDRKTARTGGWILDTGVTKHGASSLGVSRKDSVTNSIGSASGVNERSRKHKIVSVSNANSQFFPN